MSSPKSDRHLSEEHLQAVVLKQAPRTPANSRIETAEADSPISNFQDSDRTSQEFHSRAKTLEGVKAVEKRWRHDRDQFYEQLLDSEEEFEALNDLRNEYRDFLDSIADRANEGTIEVSYTEWERIAENAAWFDKQVLNLLGEQRYALLVERRDQFNKSINTDLGRFIAITSDW